jgi:2-iminobutanoate/2-iminopropanoate deaminase
MAREEIVSSKAPAPSGAYSQGIRAGDFVFLAGQGPFDAEGKRIGETVSEQVRHALRNLDAVAQAAGGSLASAVRVGVYLSDLRHFDEMNAEYLAHFTHPLPARTTIQSALEGFDVEIDAVIWVGGSTPDED